MGKEILQKDEINDTLILRVQVNKIYQNVLSDLRQQLRMYTHESSAKYIILNLAVVDVINSSGLGVLIMLADEMRKSDRVLLVVELKSLLNELFQRMRLETIFKIFKTEKQALESIRGEKRTLQQVRL